MTIFVKVFKMWSKFALPLFLLSCMASFSFAQLIPVEKVQVLDLKKVGKPVLFDNNESFDSFEYYVGKLPNGSEIVVWKTFPANFNCHFFALEPFFDFYGTGYWVDSSLENHLNQGIDSYSIFLNGYFEQIALKFVGKDFYYRVPSLTKVLASKIELQENDVFVLEDGNGEKIHSGRFVRKDDNNVPILVSKLGGREVREMTINALLKFSEYSSTYQIKIFRFSR